MSTQANHSTTLPSGLLWHIFAAAAGRCRSAWISARARRARQRSGVHAAVEIFRRGIAAVPGDAQLWNDLAALQIELQDMAAAEGSVRRALELDGDLGQAHCNLGTIRAQAGDAESALSSFERAMALQPELLAARINRAMLLSRTTEVDAAIEAWNDVLDRDGRNSQAHLAKGVLLLRAGQFNASRRALDLALECGAAPDAVAFHGALIEGAVGDLVRAIRELETLRGRFEEAQIDWALALLYISRGDFARGWPLYEARLASTFDSPRRAYGFPAWHGAPTRPGELLVMAEQGLGDEIMFASCYADVIQCAPECVIECDPRLEALFRRSFPGALIVGASRGNDRRWLERHPDLRYQVHAGSLPQLFRATAESFPRQGGYLQANSSKVQQWRERLGGLGGSARVGLAWNGGLQNTRRSLRCVPLHDMAGLLRGRADDVFVSLQHDDDGREAARLSALSGATVHTPVAGLADFDEFAALLRSLDVIITVCCSVAHAGGALGVPTWVLTPKVAEWRYQRSGETLPWYPSMRLVRQEEQGAWDAVIVKIAALLAGMRHSANTKQCQEQGAT